MIKVKLPRRFKMPPEAPQGINRPMPHAWRFGTYFPSTDLCVNDMGGRGTGEPKDVEWLDDDAHFEFINE